MPLTKRKQETLETVLDKFVSSTNYCIRRCLEHNITSRASLHTVAYDDWKTRYNLASHWFHSSGRIATQTLKSWRTQCRQGTADPNNPPTYAARTMRLERWNNEESSGICRFDGRTVQIRIRAGEWLWLPLIVTAHHEHTYLQDWREGKTAIGEITIRQFRDRAEIYVPFKREVERKPAEGLCGIDVNERSINLCSLKPGQQPKHIPINVSELPAIRHASQLKRKIVQEKLDSNPQHPLQKRRLKAKYYRRERNHTGQVIHEASKRIAAILAEERVEPVFEDLTNIRDSMRSRRKSKNGEALRRDMRRRLNQWPFHKLQQAVQYKAAQHGYETHYLPNTGDLETGVRGTSSTCPTCGQHHRPNGHAFRCPACGYEANRHEVGAQNIAVRWQTKNVGKDVRPEWRQMQPRVEEPVVPGKPEVEAQKAPQLQKATEF